MPEMVDIPVPVRDHPHWRVVLRPSGFVHDAVSTLSACREIVSKNRVSLRGWDFPHIATSANPDLHGALSGSNWIGGWTRQLEYWRFYQSKQFIHLFVVREVIEPGWHDKLSATARSHRAFDWDSVPGYFSMLNFIYTVTERVEFAARLVQAGVYEGRVSCSIGIHGIRGFVLTPEWNRAWSSLCRASEDILENEWTFAADALIADSAKFSLRVCIWFFERLGWDNPNEQVIDRDIRDFLAGRSGLSDA